LSSRGVAWQQRVWDLHSRSRVRVRACTSCKSLGQPRFYSLIWAHKVRFPVGWGFLESKKKKNLISIIIYMCVLILSPCPNALNTGDIHILAIKCEVSVVECNQNLVRRYDYEVDRLPPTLHGSSTCFGRCQSWKIHFWTCAVSRLQNI